MVRWDFRGVAAWTSVLHCSSRLWRSLGLLVLGTAPHSGSCPLLSLEGGQDRTEAVLRASRQAWQPAVKPEGRAGVLWKEPTGSRQAFGEHGAEEAPGWCCWQWGEGKDRAGNTPEQGTALICSILPQTQPCVRFSGTAGLFGCYFLFIWSQSLGHLSVFLEALGRDPGPPQSCQVGPLR